MRKQKLKIKKDVFRLQIFLVRDLQGLSLNEIHSQSFRTIKFMYTVCVFCEVGAEVSFVI
jgi:hypothetical protein